MKALTARIDDDLYDRLIQIARARDTTLSDLVRTTMASLTTIERGEDGRPELPHAGVPTSLSYVQRLQLALSHRILACVVDDGGPDGSRDGHLALAKALEEGYVADYATEFAAIQPEMSPIETTFVMDVLDMFTQLEFQVRRLSDHERAQLDADHLTALLSFSGFDQSDSRESRLLGYAQTLIEDGRWEALADRFDARHDRGNSHGPRYATYSRMLASFEPLWKEKVRRGLKIGFDGIAFSLNELQEVATAAVHPGNRSRR